MDVMIPFSDKYYSQFIDVSLSNRCILHCPKCPRTYMDEAQWKNHADISLENLEKILKTFKNVRFCGKYGDPLYHPQLNEVIELVRKYNNNVLIHTNGSGKSRKWWEGIFDRCKGTSIHWLFSMDGLPEESYMYRIGQDSENVWEIMKYGASLNLNISWQYIVFSYNENNISEAEAMANENGIEFVTIQSARWEVGNDLYKPTKMFREHPNKPFSGKIYPKCLQRNVLPLYFSLQGYFLPCVINDVKYKMEELPELIQNKFHIDNVSDIKKEILETDEWKNFYDMLYNHPENAPTHCKKMCTIDWEHRDRFYDRFY